MKPHSFNIPKIAPLSRNTLLAGGAILVLVSILFFSGILSLNSSSFTPSGKIENCDSIDRNAYGINPAVFSKLPNPPACFYTLVHAFQEGRFTDASFFTPAYYLQPEFYQTFEREGKIKWTQPNADAWGVLGYGAQPFYGEITLSPGESRTMTFFLHAGYGVRTHQGMTLTPSVDTARAANALTLSLSPQVVTQGFVLGPTFPTFSPNWTRPVELTIRAKEDAHPGTYVVSVKTASPTPDVESQLAATWGESYFNGTAYVGGQIPYYVNVHVLQK